MLKKYTFNHYIVISLIFGLATIVSIPGLQAQSGNILHGMQKLNTLGTVLYVAAHPDDENTRLISYFSNHEKTNTVYLSLTRGDGGQNLIGPELREKLGLIRTHELLQARTVDGGHQFFSRANDFGYSKTPDETLKIWDEDEVLADVVWAIRVHRPDIIVNRFNHEHNGRTHGHHTASAILSYRAFDLAGDSTAYPEQLKYVDVWQPRRLYFNTSWWFYGSREKFAEADKSNMAEVDVGQYYPLLGKSNNEISAASRSMHKCQGFGSATSRGSYMEYLELLKGDAPANKDDVLHGINTTWSRIPNGQMIDQKIDSLIQSFNPLAPHESVAGLLQVRSLISNMANSYWKNIKLREVDQLIADCTGLFLRATAPSSIAYPGEQIDWELEAINRSPVRMTLDSIRCEGLFLDTTVMTNLPNNEETIFEFSGKVGAIPTSSPYWLNEKSTLGMYHVEDQMQRGIPLSNNNLTTTAYIQIDSTTIQWQTPMQFVRTDPVQGELADPVHVVPELYLKFQEDHKLFRPNETQQFSLIIQSQVDVDTAIIDIEAPQDWLIQMDNDTIQLKAGENRLIQVSITAPGLPMVSVVQAKVSTPSATYTHGLSTIKYDHIPAEQISSPANIKLICADIRTKGSRIGYIQGAGDVVDQGLRQIGYHVDQLDIETLDAQNLQKYDAVIVGIRAFNTIDALAYQNQVLFEYTRNGGTLIVQYNTRHRLKTKDISPYPIKLSRKRVTDENAPVTFLAPDHPVLNTPNKLLKSDFDGWVQERGLYFPEEWSDEFTPILSWADPGEEQLKGSLLVASYGNGYYVYSPISYFRQFPAGVPGAFKLMANLIALGQSNRP